MQNSEQHGETILFKADGNPARITQGTVIHQRLYLHQQGSGALPHHHDRGAGSRVFGAIQENSRGVLHLAHALVGHREYTQLVDGTKPVLAAAQGSEAGVLLPLQQNRAIDHMLKHLWARQIAVLGHVPHQNQDHSGLFGITGQLCRAIPNLGHAARR